MSPPLALITGANRGLGLESARQLVRRGYRVFVGSRDLAKGQAAAREIGGDAHALRLDVSSEASIDEAVAAIDSQSRKLDVLINNAAILYDTGQRASQADLAEVRRGLETNLFGAWSLTLKALPLLKAAEGARVVNVSSGAGAIHDMGAGLPTYRISKVSLNALTRMLSAELRPFGILVNAVCPGWVATDMGGAGGRPVRDGAAGIVWAATLPKDGPSGGFFRDGQPIDWSARSCGLTRPRLIPRRDASRGSDSCCRDCGST